MSDTTPTPDDTEARLVSAPVDLSTERESRREGWRGSTCPACGGAWFRARVAIENGSVTTYAWPIVCADDQCAHVLRNPEETR